MPTAILTPRVNNNDDFVRFSRTYCEPGAQVRKGDVIADIETDKATVTVEAERDGFLLAFAQPIGEMIRVGATLAWLGDSAGETAPATEHPPEGAGAAGGSHTAEPTLKAALLLSRLGLKAAEVPASADRLTAQDVLAYVEGRNGGATVNVAPPAAGGPMPSLAPGRVVPLTVMERGMVRTVSWHRDTAVAGYVEIEYETAAWDAHAAAFQQRHGLLMSPLLPLMAYRLVQLAREAPKINSTMAGDARHEYAAINLGFTIQSGANLFLASLRDASRHSEKPFVDALALLMRQALKGKLTAEETSDITISFSSMARWQVSRHVPILPPYTSFMVAHAHGRGGVAALGASYDHRVLTGGEVAAVLRQLSAPSPATEHA